MKRALPNQPPAGNEPTAAIQWFWLLTGLSSAAALLLFRTAIDFEPGRLICGVVLIHFLPGAAVARLLRRDRLETVIYGLALSPLVITLLIYVAAFLLHLPLPAAMAGSGVVLAAALAWPLRREGPLENTRFAWPPLVPLAFGMLLALLTAAGYLGEPAKMLNVHGLYHSSGIGQIMTGVMPPDNIHLYGHSPGYQWPAWIAAAVSSILMEVSPPLSAALSRLLTFVGLFGLGYLLARDLGQKPAGRVFSGLLSVLGMNLFGGLLFLSRIALSPDLRQAMLAAGANPRLQLLLTPEFMAAHLRPRTCTIIIKLIKFSFIIPGYVAVMIAVLGAVRLFQGKTRAGYLLIFLGTATALLTHPILAVILALPFPLALFLTQLFRKRKERFPLAKLVGVALCLLFAALLVLPYLIPAMHSAGEEKVTPRLGSDIFLAMLWLYFPLGLAAAPAAIRAFRERNRQGIFIALLALTIVLFILVQRVKCDWYHLYMISIPLGLLAGDQIGRWFHRLPGKVWPAALATALGLLVLLGPGLRLQIFAKDHRPEEGRYRFSGSTMLTLQDRESDLSRAYRWIRFQTAAEAVLVEKPKKRNKEELSALSGRRVYAGKQTTHSPMPKAEEDPLGTAANRALLLLTPGTEKQQALDDLARLPDPVYLLLQRKDLRKELPVLAAEYAALPQHVHLELDLESVKIFRVLPLKPNAI